MFKQIVLPILGVLAFIAVVGIYLQKSATFPLPNITPASPTSSQKTMMIDDKIISIQIASTPDERTKGLSGVTSLDANAGMLFTFEQQNVMPGFWMKDMLISLDIIWINDGKVAKIDKNLPVPKAGTPDSKLTIYYPNQPVDFVLEVNAGYTTQNNIMVGDPVQMQSGL